MFPTLYLEVATATHFAAVLLSGGFSVGDRSPTENSINQRYY
ncbi:MAG: hypothetical protein WCI25_07575 [Actinomycetes bacterium]